MALVIRSGPAAVIASGEVTGFGGQAIRFDLREEELTFAVELGFESDPAAPELAVHTEQLPDGLRLRLVNFDAADGRGSAVPVLLGELGDELLFMHFRVFRWGRTDDRTVHYTFYRAGKDDVGWQPG